MSTTSSSDDEDIKKKKNQKNVNDKESSSDDEDKKHASKSDGEDDKDDCCPVCLEPMLKGKGKALFTTNCGHQFHYDCLIDSTHNGIVNCPICRSNMPQFKSEKKESKKGKADRTRSSDSEDLKKDAKLAMKYEKKNSFETASPPTPNITPNPNVNPNLIFELGPYYDNPNDRVWMLGNIAELPKFRFPHEWSYEWIFYVVGVLLNAANLVLTMYFFITTVILDPFGKVKPFQGACFDPIDMVENVCFFSAGQFSQGIISFGQINVGIICIGQINLGLLFGVGQLAAGWGFSVGQVASGFYVPIAQLGISIFEVKYVQFGFQLIRPFFPGRNLERACPFETCHKKKNPTLQ